MLCPDSRLKNARTLDRLAREGILDNLMLNNYWLALVDGDVVMMTEQVVEEHEMDEYIENMLSHTGYAGRQYELCIPKHSRMIDKKTETALGFLYLMRKAGKAPVYFDGCGVQDGRQ